MNELDLTSEKVTKFVSDKPIPVELMLPKQRYEVFFLKAMNDFMSYHKIPKIEAPQGNVLPHKLFSYILEVMARSMDEDKRLKLLSDLDEYKNELPFDLR